MPERIIRKYSVLPLENKNGTLNVATDRPLDRNMKRTVERMVRMPLAEHITPTSVLKNAIGLSFTSETFESDLDASAVDLVDGMILSAVKLGASDIHLEPFEERIRLRFRIDGVLREFESCSPQQYPSVAARIKVLAGLNIAEKRSPQDGAIAFEKNNVEIDLRVSTLPSLYGEKVVMRLLAGKAIQLRIDQIGLSEKDYAQFTSLIKRPYGIILIVGPTGSGKSTTLSAVLNSISNPRINVVTVEDPVEYKIEGVTQVHVGRSDKISFASALRSILRQDPDVIMVGETRDSETADISLRAALTGHLVFTTLHTNDAPGALPRLMDMGCEPFLVSSSVNAVLAQRLVRRLCSFCKEPYTPETQEFAQLDMQPQPGTEWYRPAGCDRCNGTGYKGRIGIFELLEVDEQIQKAVMAGKSADVLRGIAIENGMSLLREDAIGKLQAGMISLEEIVRVTVKQ